MEFHENKYLAWYIPRIHRPGPAINLHASGVESIAPEVLQAVRGNPWRMTEEFEAALAAWLGLARQEVVHTPGATGGNLLALLTLVRPRTRVLAEAPLYEPMLRQAERVAAVSRFERRFEDEWQLPLDEIAMLLKRDTSVVMITEPHNPSGLCAPRDQVAELAAMAGKVNATLLINEVYRGFSQTPSYHGLAENVVVVSSLSKFFGAYWARLGWLSGPAAVVKTLRAAHMNMGMGNGAGAGVGLVLLADADMYVRRAIDAAQGPLPIVDKWVRETPNLHWHVPHGPGFGTIQLPKYINDVRFAERLHDEVGVLVVPGTMFDCPGTLRLSWLQTGSALREGLEALGKALTSLA